MKKRLFLAFAMLMTFSSFCWADYELTKLAEIDWTQASAYYNDVWYSGNVSIAVSSNGLEITSNPPENANFFDSQVPMIAHLPNLKEGDNYQVTFTLDAPADGEIRLDLCSWDGSGATMQKIINVQAGQHEYTADFIDFPTACTDAMIFYQCGKMSGKHTIKMVQVYKMVGIGETYAVLDNNTLTFYYDGQKDFRSGTKYSIVDNGNGPQWEGNTSISVVRFHSSFADVRPTSTVGWFSLLTSLTKIEDIQYLNTSEVTNMGYMFNGCSGLRILNLSYFDTSKVTDMSCMFRGCDDLTTITVGDKWETQNVTSSDDMFSDCPSLVGGKGTVFDPYHTNKEYARIDGDVSGETSVPGYLTRRPSGYAVYTSSNKTFTFYNDGKMDEKTGDKYLLTIDGEVPEWLSNSNIIKVTTVVFDNSFATAYPINTSNWFSHFERLTTIEGIEYLNTDKVTEMSAMFNSCYKLQSLDLSTFNTSNVTNMTMMFSYCSQLEELDLRNFDTSNVTYMGLMFDGCKQLTELDLRSFDTHNVTTMHMMFQHCNNLVTIYANDYKWNTGNVESGGSMFYDCTSLVGGNGTRWSSDYGQWSNQSGVLYARIDGGPDNPGYLTSKLGAYALYDNHASIKTLTFYYDDQRDRRFGTKKYDLNIINITPEWISDNCYIEKVVFDETFKNARPTSTYNWFYNRTALESITGLENLNTSEVTNMYGMFRGCSSLTALTFGTSFNTSSVTNMGYMFYGCSSLTSLDLSSFNTTNVTNMSCMFEGCLELKNLKLNSFNTSSVKDMGCMFSVCSSLQTLDLSSFNTRNVTEMLSMFYDCTSLKTITVGPDWSTQNVTVSSNMFHGCEQIKGSAGTTYNEGYVDKTYAHVDGLGGPGYLTAVSYGIKVSGKAVTFANKYDVLGDETVYYDDDLNILTLNNASLTSISIASSAPNNLRIEVCGDCKVAHTASSGSAFTTNIASTTIQGVGKLTITSKNGAGINIKRSSSAGLLVKDIDLVVKGNTAGIIGTANATSTRFYSSLAFENTNCIISRVGGEQGSVGIINKMVLEKCHWTTGEFDKTNHYVLANPMVIERDVIGITTGVENGQRNSVKGQRDEWYTIDGRKLSGKPAKKGVYIHNGKAVIK